MFKKLRNIFITGVFVLLPLIVTIYILWSLFRVVDNWTSPLIELIFQRDIPGLGLILTLSLIILAGVVATNYIGKKIIQFGESVLLKIPLFRNIYTGIKGVLEGMFNQKRESFKKAILFEYPRKGIYQIGFITDETGQYFSDLTGEKMYNVFLPTTPNPTSGMFLMVPRKEAIVLDISVEEALKLIISGGILSPANRKDKNIKLEG